MEDICLGILVLMVVSYFPMEMSWLKVTQKCVDMCSYVTLLQLLELNFFYLNAEKKTKTFLTQELIKLF